MYFVSGYEGYKKENKQKQNIFSISLAFHNYFMKLEVCLNV